MLSSRLLWYICNELLLMSYDNRRQSVLQLCCSSTTPSSYSAVGTYVRHLYWFCYRLVLWVRIWHQRSASCVWVLPPAFHCGAVAVGALGGVGRTYSCGQLCRHHRAHAAGAWAQPTSSLMYKHATCHHALCLCWTALIYVMTALLCAQYYCCLLSTVGMNFSCVITL